MGVTIANTEKKIAEIIQEYISIVHPELLHMQRHDDGTWEAYDSDRDEVVLFPEPFTGEWDDVEFGKVVEKLSDAYLAEHADLNVRCDVLYIEWLENGKGCIDHVIGAWRGTC